MLPLLMCSWTAAMLTCFVEVLLPVTNFPHAPQSCTKCLVGTLVIPDSLILDP